MMKSTLVIYAIACVAVLFAPLATASPTPYVTLPQGVRCEVDAVVACEGQWPQAPVVDCPHCVEVMHVGQAVVDGDGNFTWRDANIGDPDAGGPGVWELVVGRTYAVNGWTLSADAGGVDIINNATGHGMFISDDHDVKPF